MLADALDGPGRRDDPGLEVDDRGECLHPVDQPGPGRTTMPSASLAHTAAVQVPRDPGRLLGRPRPGGSRIARAARAPGGASGVGDLPGADQAAAEDYGAGVV